MDPTIYTFGDPGLIREALLALATIFNSGAWFDSSNGFGLGGNLAAAALIGLLGIAIAAINSQQLRIDYLLTAFILFGIAFGAKTSVNVEDIQTGAGSVVDDVPIGVAYVAAMASGGARDLTETIGTAMQRVGSPTRTLGEQPFLNPLRTLLALREIRFEDLDRPLADTITDYYRYCIGTTMRVDPVRFRTDLYVRAVDPLTYATDTARVLNWATIEYTDASPGGVGASCHDVADNIRARVEGLVTLANGPVDAWVKNWLFVSRYDEPMGLGDINDAAEIVTRAGIAGQDFMAAQLIRNLHDTAEGWRTAAYGVDRATYMATLTSTFEDQRLVAAAEGSVFLQLMFPTMAFFQLMFFMLAPIIAFMIIAAPVAGMRILGFYFLFGVWAYSWWPAAEIINHYMQIAVANDFEYSTAATSGMALTSIAGFSSLYNLLATKLTIGANALASVPVIMGALLTAAPFGIASLAGRISGGGRASASVGAPRLEDVAKVGPRVSLPTGTSPSRSGALVFASASERAYGGTINVGQTARAAASASQSFAQTASTNYGAAVRDFSEFGASVERSGGVGSKQSETLSRAYSQAASAVLENVTRANNSYSFSDGQRQQLITQFGLALAGNRMTEDSMRTAGWSNDMQRAFEEMSRNQDQAVSQVNEAVQQSRDFSTDEKGGFSQRAGKVKEAKSSYEKALRASEEAQKTAESVSSMGWSAQIDTVDLVQRVANKLPSNGDPSSVLRHMGGIVAGTMGGNGLNEVNQLADRLYADDVRPLNLSGNARETIAGRGAAMILALQSKALNGDQGAMNALAQITAEGGAPPRAAPRLDEASRTAGVDGAIQTGTAVAAGAQTATAATVGVVSEASSAVDRAAASAIAAGGERTSMDAVGMANEAWLAGERNDNRGRIAAGVDEVTRYGEGAAAAMDGKPSGWATSKLSPDEGFNQQQLERLGALGTDDNAQTDGAARALVQNLAGAMRADAAGATLDPTDTYERMRGLGYSPKDAATMAFAEAGGRVRGASELLVASVVGAPAGAVASSSAAAAEQGATSAAARAAFGTARVAAGPALSALAVGVGAAYYRSADQATAEQIDQQMQREIWKAYRDENGEAKATELQQRIGPVRSAPDLVNAISAEGQLGGR